MIEKKRILIIGITYLLVFSSCTSRKVQDIEAAKITHDQGQITSISGKYQVSGIYPHLTTYSHFRLDEKQSDLRKGEPGRSISGQWECGIGAIAEWGDRMYMVNYAAHEPYGSEHKLYIVDEQLNMEIFQGSVGGTPACRMIHHESEQLFIGHYAIDKQGNIRVISIQDMPGRMTAIARHLKDPENKVYYFTMEGALYEVDVHTLKPVLLYEKPLPGWHGKGAYTSQSRLVFANNGEKWPYGVADPQWKVPLQNVFAPENFGVLAEYDGTEFRIIERKQFTDVTTRHGINAVPGDNEPLWSMGWDKRSIRLKVLDNGNWHTYLLPKAVNCNDAFHGWFTEWPRIREIHDGKFMMDMHGMFYEFPAAFSSSNTSGISPIGSHLRYIPDFMHWNGKIVLATNETSVQGNIKAGQPQSNLWFGDFQELSTWGPASGYGSVWLEDQVMAGEPSLPYLFNGFDHRMLHLINESKEHLSVRIEFDVEGNNQWSHYKTLELSPGEYVYNIFNRNEKAQWVRLVSDKTAMLTATFHYTDANLHNGADNNHMFEGLADADYEGKVSHSKLYSNHHNFNMTLHAGDIRRGQYVGGAFTHAVFKPTQSFELNKFDFTFTPEISDNTSLEVLFDKVVWSEDNASVILQTPERRLRLPKGKGYYSPRAIRNIRELQSERMLANIHGTFYELPLLYITSDPLYLMMRPVSTHNKMISDMNTWNGLLVLSGVKASAKPSPHIIRDAKSGEAVWIGGIDDLWKMGKPAGEGGPWKDANILAGQLSDMYLMTGYDQKTMQLTADKDVRITVYMHTTHYQGYDVGERPWEKIHLQPQPVVYKTFDMKAGETLTHQFPEGYSAHWVQLKADKDCVATAWFIYD